LEEEVVEGVLRHREVVVGVHRQVGVEGRQGRREGEVEEEACR